MGRMAGFLALWGLMTAASMVPATVPAIELVSRAGGSGAAFAAGYAATWLAVGAATWLALAPLGIGTLAPAVVLAAAALYEISPLKRACLARCRTPLRTVALRWREGPAGSLAMGAEHGAWCVGCCALLMALMVALGLMGFAWLAVLATVVLVQKAGPFASASRPVFALALAGAAVVAWAT
jgi:predicted metal-binding membrane protein